MRGSGLYTRLHALEKRAPHLACPECRDWPAVPGVLVVESYGDPKPYPQYCPKCGRLIYGKVCRRDLWEALI